MVQFEALFCNLLGGNLTWNSHLRAEIWARDPQLLGGALSNQPRGAVTARYTD
jgi:hypothetical protein